MVNSGENKGFLIKRRWKNWKKWQVGIPLIFILLSWPICLFFKVENAFEKCFSGGDLILFSSLLLIGVQIEITHIIHSYEKFRINKKLDDKATNSQWWATIIFFLYGIVKYCYISEMQQTIANGKTIISIFSIAIALFGITYSAKSLFFAYDRLLDMAQEEQA